MLFPVPVGDIRWINYLQRISEITGKELTQEGYCSRVEVTIGNDNSCEVIICYFSI